MPAVRPCRWLPPSLQEEEGELERVSQEEGIPLQWLRKGFARGAARTISDWEMFENADAREPLTEEEARERAVSWYGRDFDRVLNGIKRGDPMPMPCAVWCRGRLHVIGGNTRLMACRVLGMTPLVWICRGAWTRDA